jgi:tetratricopeptide (TPR) repeat protein
LIYAGRRECERAIAHYDQVLKIAPDFTIAHFNKARAFEQTGRPEEAIREYRSFLHKAGPDQESLKADARGRVAVLERQRLASRG